MKQITQKRLNSAIECHSRITIFQREREEYEMNLSISFDACKNYFIEHTTIMTNPNISLETIALPFYYNTDTDNLYDQYTEYNKQVTQTEIVNVCKSYGVVFDNTFDKQTFYALFKSFVRYFQDTHSYGYKHMKYIHKCIKQCSQNIQFANFDLNQFRYIDNRLCIYANYFKYSQYIPVTSFILDNLLKINHLPKMSLGLKRDIISRVNKSSIPQQISYKQKNKNYIIYKTRRCTIKIEYYKTFNWNRMIDEIYLKKNQIPGFDTEFFDLSDDEKTFLDELMQNTTNFNAVCMLVCAAFMNENNLKKATIAVGDKNKFSAIKCFLKAVVCVDFDNVSMEMVTNPSKCYMHNILNSQLPTIYDIEYSEKMSDYSKLNNFIKSNQFEITDKLVGRTRVSFNIPILFHAESMESIKKLRQNTDCNVIDLDKMNLLIDKIDWIEHSKIRTILTLYGLKLIATGKTWSKKSKNFDNVADKFIKRYCTRKEGAFTHKTDIKDNFIKYIENVSPSIVYGKTQIYDKLEYRDFKTEKKVINGSRVHCFMDLEFDGEKFENDFENEMDNQNGMSVEDLLNELKDARFTSEI